MSSELKTTDPLKIACNAINEYSKTHISPLVQEFRGELADLADELERRRAIDWETASVEHTISDLLYKFSSQVVDLLRELNQQNFIIELLLDFRQHNLGSNVNHWRHISGFEESDFNKINLINIISFDELGVDNLYFEDRNICTTVETAIFITPFKDKISYLPKSKTPSPCLVKCHPGIMIHVMLELLENAKHAIGDDGSIEVDIETDNDFVSIIIKDNGEGIPSDNLERVTQQGFTTKEKGTGQGLYLIKSYIETTLGGKFEIQSIEGIGTTVKIVLPLSKNDD